MQFPSYGFLKPLNDKLTFVTPADGFRTSKQAYRAELQSFLGKQHG
jgi:hypothetical protein